MDTNQPPAENQPEPKDFNNDQFDEEIRKLNNNERNIFGRVCQRYPEVDKSLILFICQSSQFNENSIIRVIDTNLKLFKK